MEGQRIRLLCNYQGVSDLPSQSNDVDIKSLRRRAVGLVMQNMILFNLRYHLHKSDTVKHYLSRQQETYNEPTEVHRRILPA